MKRMNLATAATSVGVAIGAFIFGGHRRKPQTSVITPSADDDAPKDISRTLARGFFVLLFLFLILSGGTYCAVSSALSAKEYDSIVLNIAGRQRMLTQKYAREINQVLMGLSVGDQEMMTEAMKAAARTTKAYEQTLTAFLEGGEVDVGEIEKFWIPPSEDLNIVEHLGHIEVAWKKLRSITIQAILSKDPFLARKSYVMDIQTRTTHAVSEMDHVVALLQKESEARLSRVGSYIICASILGALLLVGTVVFVRTRIVAPLRDSMATLRDSMARAEIADRAKSDFLANMSHEIRTPMTAILGFAETVAENLTEPENVKAIATIRRNGKYLLTLINDILDLSKIEAGKMGVEHVACSPCQIVAESASIMSVRADTKGLAFNIEYIGRIPETIQSDPIRLRQILVNLIGNSIKFTDEGAVRLIVRFVDAAKGDAADSPRGACLQFDILDTGLGISDEQASGLFDPFTQADNSTTRQFGGTGLGLTISKRFAELLGGEITLVESAVGVGTRFRATIATGLLDGVAMLDDPMCATVVADISADAAPTLPSNLKGLRILLAEDGPDNQRLISFILKKVGADVIVVENGKLALDTALAARDGGSPFDCILMDMQMPVVDGYDATRQLRQQGYAEAIIALTAHAMAGDRRKCIDAGCDDYATKPIQRNKLIEIIRANVGRRESSMVSRQGPVKVQVL